jgi:hypothetical protein
MLLLSTFFLGVFWDDFCSCYDGLCVLLLRIGFLSLFSSCCIPCFLDAVKNILYYYCFFLFVVVMLITFLAFLVHGCSSVLSRDCFFFLVVVLIL